MTDPEQAPVDDGVEAEEQLLAALFSPPGRQDPHTFFRSVSLPGCRYAVAEKMLRDARLGPPLVGRSQEPLWQIFAHWLINLDGERHIRVRRPFAGLFTPRRIDAFRSVIAERATALLDGIFDQGRMDLVVDFARPLPYTVIVRILGIPDDRHGWIAERMFTLGQGFSHQREPEFLQRAGAAVTEMLDYYLELLDERKADPRDDLLSALAANGPDDEEGRLDVAANCIFFVEAGHVTTTSLISAGMLLLLGHPVQLERLRSDPTATSRAIEEMLRWITPVTQAVCRAREDVEIDGFRFPAGAHRHVWLAAANRDPSVFDAPDEFDIERNPNRHLAFSAGAHFCLGAPLARLHGEIATTSLLRRLPGLRLEGEPVWRGSVPIRELEHLPVGWDR